MLSQPTLLIQNFLYVLKYHGISAAKTTPEVSPLGHYQARVHRASLLAQ